MPAVAFYDTKPYDREFMLAAAGGAEASGGPDGIRWLFREFRLTADTAATAEGATAVCGFVNDVLDRNCLATLAGAGIRHVALRCAGFNNIDLAAARELGLVVTRVPAYSPYAVAEHTVALVLALNRRIHRAYNRVREQNFSLAGLVGFDLHGKTCGIVGTGKIGRVAAEIFKGFGMRVVAHDPYPLADWATAHGIDYLPLDELLAASDIVSLHLPLTPETHHLVSAATLDRMAITVDGAPVISIPIAICLFFMMYPIMVKIDFAEVLQAGRSLRPVLLTLVVLPAAHADSGHYQPSCHQELPTEPISLHDETPGMNSTAGEASEAAWRCVNPLDPSFRV